MVKYASTSSFSLSTAMDDDIMGELDGKGREESKLVWARVCAVDDDGTHTRPRHATALLTYANCCNYLYSNIDINIIYSTGTPVL